jgi:hypothetical protein
VREIMSVRRRRFGLLGSIAGSLAIALFLGAAERSAADLVGPNCGKGICVAVEDQPQASFSILAAPPAPGVPRYMADTITLSNGGASNLVNVDLRVSWVDVLNGVEQPASTTSDFVSVSVSSVPESLGSGLTCSRGTGLTLTCTTPKSLSPGQRVSYTVVFRTATDMRTMASDKQDTRVTAVAQAKERGNDKKFDPSDPSSETASASNLTPYEVSPDEDVSWAGGGLEVTLATTAPSAGQFSKLPLPATLSPNFATLTETDCPATGATCIGQKVTTQAFEISPINLQIFYTGPLPPGLTTMNLVVVHNGVSITRACSGDFFQTPTDLSTAGACRRVSIDRSGPGDPRVIVDAWDLSNGDWTWG